MQKLPNYIFLKNGNKCPNYNFFFLLQVLTINLKKKFCIGNEHLTR